MKKIILLLISLNLLIKVAGAQIVMGAYSQSYPTGATDKPSSFGLITAVLEINDSFWTAYPNEQLHSIIARDSSFMHSRPAEFVAVNIIDTAKAQFFLHGVTPANAGKFEYRVFKWNGKDIIPWTAVTKFTDKLFSTTSGWPQMGYLGGYAPELGDWIVIDVRNKSTGRILASSVVARVQVKPELAGIYPPNQLNIFLARLARPWSYKLTPEEAYYWHSRYADNQLDVLTGLPKKFIGEANENNLVFYLRADIYNKTQLEYELLKDDKMLTNWKVNDFDNGFVWLRDLSPGEYLLKMRYTAQREHVTQYPFQIKAPWFESLWFNIIASILATGFVAFLISLVYYLNQKQKAKEELSKKTKLQLELKAIYAQLNPHFIFNALSSIQGLINKQDIKGANNYLIDFAALMRGSLNNSDKDQVALKVELETLETYLKLEQLRFGFNYQIKTDTHINVYETEIPSLLLQPLVENAVKHGVSALQDRGSITINFIKKQNDMIVTITDNGKGFKIGEKTNGFGLKLTRDRIKLLNELATGQPVIFDVQLNKPTGAVMELTFKNWFL